MTISPHTIGDIATLVRSKNAGPFWLTIDIFCDSDTDYEVVAHPDVITANRIAEIYHVEASTVKIFRLAALRAIKVSVPRPTTQGGVRDRDMHSGQQHVPLMRLTLSSSN